MNKYYYLDISLDFADKIAYEITTEYFKNNLIVSIAELFGEAASCVDIDILKYTSEKRRAIVRVPADHFVKFRSSLTLCGHFRGDKCIYKVHKASPILLSLQGDSRDFQH